MATQRRALRCRIATAAIILATLAGCTQAPEPKAPNWHHTPGTGMTTYAVSGTHSNSYGQFAKLTVQCRQDKPEARIRASEKFPWGRKPAAFHDVGLYHCTVHQKRNLQPYRQQQLPTLHWLRHDRLTIANEDFSPILDRLIGGNISHLMAMTEKQHGQYVIMDFTVHDTANAVREILPCYEPPDPQLQGSDAIQFGPPPPFELTKKRSELPALSRKSANGPRAIPALHRKYGATKQQRRIAAISVSRTPLLPPANCSTPERHSRKPAPDLERAANLKQR